MPANGRWDLIRRLKVMRPLAVLYRERMLSKLQRPLNQSSSIQYTKISLLMTNFNITDRVVKKIKKTKIILSAYPCLDDRST